MTKTIDTLVEDIYSVFTEHHEVSEELLEEFGENCKNSLRTAIESANVAREPYLRMSIIGKPDRLIWYELNDPVEHNPQVNPQKFIMFLYGDLLEQLLIFLAKSSGHSVTHNQEELEIGGVVGHCDPVIDGVPTDIKSASKFSFFKKFKTGGLLRGDDPFGYVGQLSAYREKLLEKFPDEIDPSKVAWLAINKETGELCVLEADPMDLINAEDRVEHLKEIIEVDTPPKDKCYPEVPEGKSGNKTISSQCQWCPFKHKCWADANDGQGLRAFKYSNGVKYFTEVNKLPSVEEITYAE